MKKLSFFPLCLGCVFAAGASHAIDLKQSKVTQVVNDVQIISAADQKQKAATVSDIFSMPDILRTGAASRAELVAPDETVTRVGANTVFSFDPANRTIDLKQGSLLFHAPHGKGGGTIHTGSATASVLGTTIIVVTTPNGGFKLIDLEGQAEIHFLNGLRQKLDAGQMTFILPGANQLAPVIIFRLDELMLNSLLVKGFSQPLDSLPLIQNQIDKQLKLIGSGKATDTGLYAGDDASPNQVEVLDPNTIPHSQQKQSPPPSSPPPPPPVVVPTIGAAEGADATLIQPSLTDISIPTPPVHVFTGTPFGLNGNSFFNGQSFSGFVARNIFINTPTVNLAPYSGQSEFDFVAVNNISLENSVTFNGFSPAANLSLIAGGLLSFAPDIAVTGDANSFTLASPQALTLNGVQLANNVGALTLNSGDAISFQNFFSVFAKGNLNVSAVNDISAIGGTLRAPYARILAAGPDFTAANAQFASLTGSILFDSATLNVSGHAIFTAPTALTFNNSTLNANDLVLNGASSATATLNYTTVNTPSSLTVLTANALDITGSTLNSSAASGSVKLQSIFGSVNVSGTPVTAQVLTVIAGDSISFDEGQSIGGGGGEVAAAKTKSVSVPAHYLKLNSGDGVLLTPRGKLLDLAGVSTASFTAPNTIAVNNSDLTSYANVNMAANTINLYNVAFSGIVNLNSLYGEWHNGSVVYGMVNDLGNVTWNGMLVNAANGASGTLYGTEITVGSTGGGGGLSRR